MDSSRDGLGFGELFVVEPGRAVGPIQRSADSGGVDRVSRARESAARPTTGRFCATLLSGYPTGADRGNVWLASETSQPHVDRRNGKSRRRFFRRFDEMNVRAGGNWCW